MKQTRRQFVRTLFAATQATLVGSLWPGPLFAEDAKGGGLNFLVVGDWGREGEPDQVRVANQMGVAAGKLNAKFVVSVGDNFYNNGVTSVDDPKWQRNFERVYRDESLQAPWYVVLGNHDYHGNSQAQVDYTKTSRRWRMPTRYYKRSEKISDAALVDFFFIDTTPMASFHGVEEIFRKHLKDEDVPAQMKWFEAALASSVAPWKIVVGHHPIFSGGEHGDTPYLVEHVLPLLEKYKVQVYFNGHDHDLQHLQAGPVNLFCSGAGSRMRPTKDTPHTRFAESCSGFMTAALRPDKMEVRMIDDGGRQIYSAEVPRTAA